MQMVTDSKVPVITCVYLALSTDTEPYFFQSTFLLTINIQHLQLTYENPNPTCLSNK
jgi:hypothetical protein